MRNQFLSLFSWGLVFTGCSVMRPAVAQEKVPAPPVNRTELCSMAPVVGASSAPPRSTCSTAPVVMKLSDSNAGDLSITTETKAKGADTRYSVAFDMGSVAPGTDQKSGKSPKSAAVPGDGENSPLNCQSKRIEYTPLPAFPAGGYTSVTFKDSVATVATQDWPGTAEKVNALLNNISTNIALSDSQTSGNVASIFGGSYIKRQVVIDFMKYRSEPMKDLNNVISGYARVGAGLRVIINVITKDANISGSLFALAASAKASKTEGTISVEAIGIDAPDVTLSMPFTVDLSEGNIQKVIEALAIVKAKLYDAKTTLYPQFIARIECAKEQLAVK